jgi:hypothetical protein
MRDPTVNASVDEAIEAVRSVFDRHREYFQPVPNKERIAYIDRLTQAGQYVTRDDAMPEDVRKVLSELVLTKLMESHRERVRYPGGANWRRDRAITEAVEYVVKLGFSRTRNAATRDKRESACSIVRVALKRIGVPMKEGTIADLSRPKCPG